MASMLLLSALRGRLSGHPVLYRQCPCATSATSATSITSITMRRSLTDSPLRLGLQSATAAYSTSACPIVRFKSTVTGVASSTEDQVDQVKHTHTGAAIDDPTEHDQEAASGTLSTSRQPSGPMENPEFHRGTVWFDNIFPFHLGLFDPRSYWVRRYANKFLLNASWKRLIPDTFPTGAEFQFREAEPNVKEGGLYLKFKYKGGTIDEAIEAIQTHVRSTGVRSIFNFGLINAFEVKGRPWVEDMVFRIPSRRLHVEFHGPDLSVEQLYCEFRNFGRIMDITIQPSSVKDLPRFASIEFVRKRSATSARNCIHGEMIDGTRVHIGYEKVRSTFSIWTWILSNLRISIPILLAVAAAVSYIVFDPLRVFSIVNKLTGRFSFVKYAESAGEMWMGAQSSFHAFFFAKGYSGMSGGSGNDIIKTLTHAFDERESEAKRLELHFKQTPDTLVIINGPKGSGKSDLVRKALEHHKNKLVIQCEDLIGQPEHVLISRLASQVNFFPSFGFMSQITTFMDAIITATTGAKAGMGTTKEAEVRKILDCVTKAVTDLTLDQREARQELLDDLAHKDTNTPGVVVPEIEYPVIIIDGFLGKENSKGHFIYDMMAEWAAIVATQYRVAHVVFVSDNPAAVREIGKVIPTKSVETFILRDASPESSLAYVKRRLPEFEDKSLWPSIQELGGRLHDLDLLIQKVHAGQTPKDAFEDMLHRSVTELRKIGLNAESDKSQHEWTDVQFWKVVQMLSKFGEVPFDNLVMHAIFKGDPLPLMQMERDGLITLTHSYDRPYIVRPGKPIYRTAFTLMTKDDKLVSTMGIMTAKQLISDEEKRIRIMEEEMRALGELLQTSSTNRSSFWSNGPTQIWSRLDFLMTKLGDSSKRIAAWSDDESRFKKQLKLVE